MSKIITPEYFSGQGQAILFNRNAAGMPATGFWQGDVSALEFTVETSQTDYKENWTGQRGTALSVENEIVTGINMTVLQMSTKLLTTQYRGEEVTQSVTPVVDQVISDLTGTLEVGDRFTLGAYNVSAVTIEDSTGTPISLVAGTNYELDAVTGDIKILDATTNGPFVLPLKASYTPGAATSVKLMTAAKTQFWLGFRGINTVANGQPKGSLDLYKVELSMPQTLALINDTRFEGAITGKVLTDALKSSTGDLGQRGRIFGFGVASE